MGNLFNFKDQFQGGSRSNRFRISGSFPGGSFTDYHIRATTIPSVATKTLTYDFFGRKFNYPGEKEYGTWSFQVLDDTGEANLWGKLQQWQNQINDHDTNISSLTDSYKADNWFIEHLDINGNATPLKRFKLHGCWPTAIQPISLNMGSPNVLNSFNVIIVYDYIEIVSNGVNVTNNT